MELLKRLINFAGAPGDAGKLPGQSAAARRAAIGRRRLTSTATCRAPLDGLQAQPDYPGRPGWHPGSQPRHWNALGRMQLGRSAGAAVPRACLHMLAARRADAGGAATPNACLQAAQRLIMHDAGGAAGVQGLADLPNCALGGAHRRRTNQPPTCVLCAWPASLGSAVAGKHSDDNVPLQNGRNRGHCHGALSSLGHACIAVHHTLPLPANTFQGCCWSQPRQAPVSASITASGVTCRTPSMWCRKLRWSSYAAQPLLPLPLAALAASCGPNTSAL